MESERAELIEQRLGRVVVVRGERVGEIGKMLVKGYKLPLIK